MVIPWYSLNNFEGLRKLLCIYQNTMVLPFDNITLSWYHTVYNINFHSEFVLHYFNQNIWF